MRRFWWMLLVPLLLVGCGGLSVEDGFLNVPVTVTAEQFNQLVSTAQAAAAERGEGALLGNVSRVEFIEPDTARVYGSYTDANGQVYDGNFDAAVAVVNEQLSVQVTQVNVSGHTVSDATIASVNETLSQQLTALSQASGQGGVRSVQVVNGQLEVVIAVPLEQAQ